MYVTSEKGAFRLIIVALVLGTLYRLHPIFIGLPTLRQFFMTEDGYLMLTVARNIAIGLGMSVSEGTIHTNGVQPLSTFLFTLPYLVTSGDKVAGLVGVHLTLVAVSIFGLLSVRALAQLLLKPLDSSPVWPWFAAALWYLGPIPLFHTMNGLETGLYTAGLTVTLVIFGSVLARGHEARLSDRLILGAACGITFLVRNDGVFLVMSIFAVWGLNGIFNLRQNLLRVMADLVPAGLLCSAIAAPWLVNNYVNFGSVMPISGTAQALSGGFAENAHLLPAILFEYVFPMLPVPGQLQTQPVFMVLALGVVLAIVLTYVLDAWRRSDICRPVLAAYGLFSLLMVAYYGFSFGAGWFLSRYLAPLAPLLIISTIWVLVVLSRLAATQASRLARLTGLAAIALSIVLLARALIPGVHEQGHFQVVDWVTENVPETTWVGAVQTGTLGYWHDRTINLDGKVNPQALQALLEEGHVLNYVLRSPIEYVADWVGIAKWVTTGNLGVTAFSNDFRVVVENEEQNLAVLRRVQ